MNCSQNGLNLVYVNLMLNFCVVELAQLGYVTLATSPPLVIYFLFSQHMITWYDHLTGSGG